MSFGTPVGRAVGARRGTSYGTIVRGLSFGKGTFVLRFRVRCPQLNILLASTR